MSCKHGQWHKCELCDAEDDAYESGKASRDTEIAELQTQLCEQRGAHERAAHVVRDLQAEIKRLKLYESMAAEYGLSWFGDMAVLVEERDRLQSWQESTKQLLEALMKYREGELPNAGWLRDNDSTRAILQALFLQLSPPTTRDPRNASMTIAQVEAGYFYPNNPPPTSDEQKPKLPDPFWYVPSAQTEGGTT